MYSVWKTGLLWAGFFASGTGFIVPNVSILHRNNAKCHGKYFNPYLQMFNNGLKLKKSFVKEK